MTKRKTARTLLAELHQLMDAGKVDPQRVIQYVRDKARQPRGRPVISPADRRSVTVTARLTTFEREQLDKLLLTKRQTFSAWIRSVIEQHTQEAVHGDKRDGSRSPREVHGSDADSEDAEA